MLRKRKHPALEKRFCQPVHMKLLAVLRMTGYVTDCQYYSFIKDSQIEYVIIKID